MARGVVLACLLGLWPGVAPANSPRRSAQLRPHSRPCRAEPSSPTSPRSPQRRRACPRGRRSIADSPPPSAARSPSRTRPWPRSSTPTPPAMPPRTHSPTCAANRPNSRGRCAAMRPTRFAIAPPRAALEDYYKLAAVEGQFDLAAAGHKVLSKQLSEAEKAIQQGLKDRGDVNAIRRQLLELESQAAKLDGGARALNASLAGRLGLDTGAPLWPADALRVSAEVADVETSVATARLYRPDLNLLRALVADADRGGELANHVLNGINPLLGNSSAIHPFFAVVVSLRHDPTRLESGTRRQLLGAGIARAAGRGGGPCRCGHAPQRRAAAAAKAAEVRNLVGASPNWRSARRPASRSRSNSSPPAWTSSRSAANSSRPSPTGTSPT